MVFQPFPFARFFVIPNLINFLVNILQHPLSSQLFFCLAPDYPEVAKIATVLRYFLLSFYA